MPRDSARALQLPLFIRDTVGYLDAVARYEAIRPVLKGERSYRRRAAFPGSTIGGCGGICSAFSAAVSWA
jgi:hypothetical protein